MAVCAGVPACEALASAISRVPAEAIRRAPLDEGDRLQRFDGRAGKDRGVDVADGAHQLSPRSRQGHCARVHAFHAWAAGQLDEDWVAHDVVTSQGNIGCLTIPAGSPEDNRALRERGGSWSFRAQMNSRDRRAAAHTGRRQAGDASAGLAGLSVAFSAPST